MLASRSKWQVLLGAHDAGSSLHSLCGNSLVLSRIFEILDDLTYPAYIDRESVAYYDIVDKYDFPQQSIQFPPPSGININMMPIRGRYGIPDNCAGYERIIRSCPGVFAAFAKGRVFYLTIQESLVQPGETQRRAGLHIERMGAGKVSALTRSWLRTMSDADSTAYCDTDENCIQWGCGRFVDNAPLDGIYMASSVTDSCAIWPVTIVDSDAIVDDHGGLEHLRKHLGAPRLLKANELIWFTDRTPHEALPNQSSVPVYRQFFRLVVGPVSHWYSRHNTPNPDGVQPDAIIVDQDKFA